MVLIHKIKIYLPLWTPKTPPTLQCRRVRCNWTLRPDAFQDGSRPLRYHGPQYEIAPQLWRVFLDIDYAKIPGIAVRGIFIYRGSERLARTISFQNHGRSFSRIGIRRQ